MDKKSKKQKEKKVKVRKSKFDNALKQALNYKSKDGKS